MNPKHLDKRALLTAILLAGMTLAVFAPVIGFQFINIDDSVYVVGNEHVQQGLNRLTAQWAMTSLEAANWHPVTWLSHLLDVSLFGLNPHGHHATSLLLHTLNVVLLFLWLRSMTGALWKSAIVAAIFAVHPLGLESVAWIAERKNVLSTLFMLLALWAYVGYARKPGVLRYLLVALSFALGLMAKPMIVTLPFVFLLLDYWPLRRLGFGAAASSEQEVGSEPVTDHPLESSTHNSPFYRLLEKIPLLILAIVSSVMTMKAQALDHEIKVVSLSSRIANALLSYQTYLRQMVWSSKLAIFYPYRDFAIVSRPILAALFLVLTITALTVWQIKKRPYLAVGWLWYLGTLVPAIGLIHVGDISHADRYTYVPMIGILIAVVWGIAEVGKSQPALRYGLIATAATAVLLLAVTTTRDVYYWHDGVSISERSLSITGPNCLMERSLGEAFYNEGQIDEALEHLVRSVKIEPTDTALFEIGTIKFQQAKLDEASFYYQQALQYPAENKTLAQIHNNLAVLEMQQGSLAEAEKHFQQSLALDPRSSRHRIAYGWLLAKEARYDDAIAQYTAAMQGAPDPLAYFSIGSALEEEHKFREAAEAYRTTVSLAPNFREAQMRIDALNAAHQLN
jgi:tetratricopeptide (TPR) repeat protein